MNSANASLVNRLILLVLSLILVCLVMLVIRAYQEPIPSDTSAVIVEAQPPAVGEMPPPVEFVPIRRPEPPRRISPTNTTRLVAAGRPSPLPSAPLVADVPSTTEQPVSTSITQFESVVVHERAPAGSVREGGTPSGQPGEITGIVTLSGTPKPEIPIDLGPTCGYHFSEKRTTRHFIVGPNGGLANVLVSIQGAENIKARATEPQELPLLDQVGCMYEPYLMGILVGQRFRIRNSDPVLHSVHATPKNNREFNLGQPLQGQVDERSFAKSELFIRVKCDVHPWMFAYINVVPHPFFAVTDTNGFFRLPAGLTSGGYTINAAHLKAGELNQRIKLQADRPNTLNFQFTVPSSTQPQGRIARAE